MCINLLKKGVHVFQNLDVQLPQEIESKGLDAIRQWYSHTKVAPYCINKKRLPFAYIAQTELNLLTSATENDNKRKCGQCKLTGHCK